MLLERLYERDLAQASFLIGCEQTGEALVVDANRDVARYLQAADRARLHITHVAETHIHADFVSGSQELARRANARLLLSAEGGPDWSYGFVGDPNAVALRDGDTFNVGRIRVEVVHTPGHTPEHVAFLITDTASANAPMGIITGDALFVGDVGRPDLLVRTRDNRSDDSAAHAELAASAERLFHTVNRFREMPEHLQVWPGHGAGSACGKSLGAVPQSTIGYELRFNWAFRAQSVQDFVATVLAGQPEPPRYFARMKRLNRDGPPALGMLPAPATLACEALPNLQRGGVTVVDTRSSKAFAEGHLPGSINIPLGTSFVTWAGSVLPDDAVIAPLVEGGAGGAQAPARSLALIGIDDVRGVFDETVLEWQAAHGGLATLPQTDPQAAANAATSHRIIDVRGATEWNAGHIPGAEHIPLAELASALPGIANVPTIVHCQGGTRSSIAASMMRAAGMTTVVNMTGGFSAWQKEGLPVTDDASGSSAEDEEARTVSRLP
jgi:hydroxyacylglutathione hydrolase